MSRYECAGSSGAAALCADVLDTCTVKADFRIVVSRVAQPRR